MLDAKIREQVWHMMGEDREQFGKFMYAYYAGVYGDWINPLATAEETGPKAKPFMRRNLDMRTLRWYAEEHPRVASLDWASMVPETKPAHKVRRTASSGPRVVR